MNIKVRDRNRIGGGRYICEDRGWGKELRVRRMIEKGSGRRVRNGGETGKEEV